ncbi:hypothetical protein [Massilibacterium senegalense]|uniref:hypothetical protein n=1 Tax=Massilibacterium senegalense TaxID=1632858 RepID=UPI000784A7DB|nr:hypothetical protein [Massilibacterium senegalense]
MDEKKKIIINEIHYWKENKLLPETYCNFLLALYTGGEKIAEKDKERKTTMFNGIHAVLSFFFLLLLIGVALVIYFTDFSIQLQITFGIFVLLFLIGMMMYLRKNKSISYYVAVFIIALLILLLGNELLLRIVPSFSSAVVYYTFINCIIWIIFGKKVKMKFLSYAGVGGLALMVIILLYRLFF